MALIGFGGGVVGGATVAGVLWVYRKRSHKLPPESEADKVSSGGQQSSGQLEVEVDNLKRQVSTQQTHAMRQRHGSMYSADKELRKQLELIHQRIDAIGGTSQADDEQWMEQAMDAGSPAMHAGVDHALHMAWAMDHEVSPAFRRGAKSSWGPVNPSSSNDAADGPSDSAAPLILVSDFGGVQKDVGDQLAMFFLRGLEELGLVRALALIVAGPGPADRAHTAIDVVSGLGVGTPNSTVEASHSTARPTGAAGCLVGIGEGVVTTGSPPAAPTAPVVSAEEALETVMMDHGVADYSLIIVQLTAYTDLAAFLKKRRELAKRKIRHVVVLGAVTEARDAFTHAYHTQTDAFLRPDPAYEHHAADPEAAEFVYQTLQELAIPLIVIGRHTVYKAAAPALLYDDLARTNSSLACALKTAQRNAIDDLWRRVHAPPGSKGRGALPARCTPDWFGQVFCGGMVPSKGPTASPWECVTAFNLYDAVALAASVPELRYKFFSDDAEYDYDCGTAVHSIYGQREATSGVRHPTQLTNLITSAALAGVSSRPEPYPMIIFTDPGQDLDDELTLTLLASLVTRRFVRVLAVVCNLGPALPRARLAKGMLTRLGLGDIPVAAGTDGGRSDHKDGFSESASSYLAGEDELEPSADKLLTRVLSAEADQSVLVLCISSLSDAWRLVQREESLFARKVHSVTIMGGVELSDEVLNTSPPQRPGAPAAAAEDILLVPDTANNNTFDMEAARGFYRKVQSLSIRLNVCTRFSAYGCPMPRKVYDAMAATGSPIARRLMDVQRTSIEDLWRRCNATGAERLGLPERCNKPWYCKTFLKGAGEDRRGDESIWDLVQQFNFYDVLALVYAVPHLSWRFFEPTALGRAASGAEAARVVGLGPKDPGVKAPARLREFIFTGLMDALQASEAQARARGE